MVITKGCPRCQGDLAYVDDVGDAYYSCVQCGFVEYKHAADRPRLLHEVPAARSRPGWPPASAGRLTRVGR